MMRKVLKVAPVQGGDFRYTLSCGHHQCGREPKPKKVKCRQCGGA